MVWQAIIPAVISAASSIYGASQSKKAGDAQKNAAQRDLQLQQNALNAQYSMYEPNRALGYGAASDLASLYGYGMPAYTPLNSLINGQYGQPASGGGSNGGSPLPLNAPMPPGVADNPQTRNALKGSVLGAAIGPAESMALGIGGFLGTHSAPNFKGTIDPTTGTVTVPGHADREAKLTEYLRTGVGDFGPHNKVRGLVKQIDKLRGSGWTYTDPATQAAANGGVSQTPGLTGQPGNMSRFFTSPDYQFRLDEGQRNIGNSFAARGGAASGNALRALTEFNQNTASGEYGNYFNRLMGMAGLGQTATSGASAATANAAGNMGQAYQNIGDARASGIYGQTNSILNGVNTGLNLWQSMRGSGGNTDWLQPINTGQFGQLYRYPR